MRTVSSNVEEDRTHTYKHAWTLRGALALATTVAGVSIAIAAESNLITNPAVLSPHAGTRSSVRLPVSALGEVNKLDLSKPAQVKLPAAPVIEQDLVDHIPEISMPSLVAPQTTEPRIAMAPESPAPSEESDEESCAPEEFTPEWRSPKQVATEESIQDAPAPLPDFDESEEAAQERTEVAEQQPAAAPNKTAEASDPPAESNTSPQTQSDRQVVQAPVEPPRELKPLTRNQIYLRNKMRKVLSYYYRKPMDSRDYDSWKVMHNMLAFELHSRILAGGPKGQSMTSIGWLCYNNSCAGHQLMALSDEGLPHGVYGVGKEGHSGQFLSMLAQCNVDPSYPVRVQGHEFTIHDLIRGEQRSCRSNSELSFKLIAFMHYLPSDATWVNDQGEAWSMERLIREEINQPIRGVACGGTHRLNGLSLAVKQREKRGEPVEGIWLEAKNFTDQYEQYCYRLQNSDGSWSTEWFRGPGDEKDIDRRCRTTGHLTEWILYHVDDDQLDSYRVVKAVNYLTNLLYSNADHEWETGAVSHALHALTEYDTRMFKPYDEQAAQARANQTKASNSVSRQNTSSRQR